jgi:hypothetical protein
MAADGLGDRVVLGLRESGLSPSCEDLDAACDDLGEFDESALAGGELTRGDISGLAETAPFESLVDRRAGLARCFRTSPQ